MSDLHVAVKRSANNEVVEIVNTQPEELVMQDEFGFTPLHWVARYGNLKYDVINLIISESPSTVMETYNKENQAPLHLAVRFNKLSDDAIKIILEKSSSHVLSAFDKTGRTPLHWAAAEGQLSDELTKLIINKTPPDVIMRGDNMDGNTPLHLYLSRNIKYESHRLAAVAIFQKSPGATYVVNKGGKTPSDHYLRNTCTTYENEQRDNCIKKILDILKGVLPIEILAMDPTALSSYERALENGSARCFCSCIFIVGEERAGKTSLVKALIGKPFNDKEEMTDGIVTTILGKINHHSGVWEHLIHVKDLARSTFYEAIATKTCEIMKQITRGTMKFTNTQYWMEPKTNTSPITEEQESSEVKKDKANRSGDEGEVEDNNEMETSQKKRFGHFEAEKIPGEIAQLMSRHISGKSGPQEHLSLKIYDFAGQRVYSATHQVFLTSRGVYCLVFNLLDFFELTSLVQNRDPPTPMMCRMNFIVLVGLILSCLNLFNVGWLNIIFSLFVLVCIFKIGYFDSLLERTLLWYNPPQTISRSVFKPDDSKLEALDFWLKSIFANTTENTQTGKQEQKSPPIIRIGTHRDCITGSPDEIRKLVDELNNYILEFLKDKPYNGHVVSKLYAIDSTTADDYEIPKLRRHLTCVLENEPYMQFPTPLTWLQVEARFEEKRQHGIHFMKLNEIKDIMMECGVRACDLFHVLQYNNAIGNIVYAGKEDDSEDEPLRNIVVLNPQLLVDVFKAVITSKHPTSQCANLRESWAKLKDGILDEKLAQHIWRNIGVEIEYLLKILNRYDLLFEKEISTEVSCRSSREFIVPTLLKESLEVPTVVKDNDLSAVVFYIDFFGFLQEDIFHRLLVRVTGWLQKRGHHEYRLSRQNAEFNLDEEHSLTLQILQSKKSLIRVTVLRCLRILEPTPEVCKMVYTLVLGALNHICGVWNKRVKFEFCMPCHGCSKVNIVHLHPFDVCQASDKVECGNNRMDTLRFKHCFLDGFDLQYIERRNFLKIQRLVIERGTEEMRKFVLDKMKLRRTDFGKLLLSEKRKGSFKGAKLFQRHLREMLKSNTNIDEVDISTMMVIIRHCCGCSPPHDPIWTKPDENDTSVVANFVRIHNYRNDVIAHNAQNRIKSEKFKVEWNKLSNIFRGVGLTNDELLKYREDRI